MKRVIVALLVAFSTGFFIFSTDASAYSGWTNLSNVTLRRTYISGSNQNIVGELVGYVPLPYNVVSYGWLEGITLHTIDVSGGNFKQYNVIYLDVQMQGQNYWMSSLDYKPLSASLRDNMNTWYDMNCEYSSETTSSVQVRCTVALPQNRTPSVIDFYWGCQNGGCILAYATVAPIRLSYVGWGYDTSEDPAVQYLQQMSQQNQTIINQNQTVIDQNTQIINQQNQTNQNLSDINSSITDSNVSGDFSVSPIPAFGPIAGILNNLLELPRILLAVPACTPIRPVLPYVNEQIEIPCMSTIYAQAYPAFITFLDAITSAYIWFRVARYIVRQVQRLRDPEQEDEEYLDI